MKITIIGAGIGGLTTAIALKKFRPEVELEIFESSPELKAAGAALGLAANAVMAFEQLDIKEKVLAKGHILEKFRILNKNGKLITETNNLTVNKNFNTISSFSIQRTDLQSILLNELGQVKLYLDKKLRSFKRDEKKITLQFTDGSTTETDYVIAADGIHSVMRQILLPASVTRFAGSTCWRGITDMQPAGFNDTVATETWADGKRFGIVPLAGKKIYWFACINSPAEKNKIFASYTKFQLLESFRGFHSPVGEIIGLTEKHDISWNDIIDLKPISNFAFDNILLLGDAAHATTPNMAQGACQAIEGAVLLGKTLSATGDINEAFKIFEQKRLKRTRQIVDRSWQIGKIAQLQNPVATNIRDIILRMIPSSFNEKQAAAILNVNFD